MNPMVMRMKPAAVAHVLVRITAAALIAALWLDGGGGSIGADLRLDGSMGPDNSRPYASLQSMSADKQEESSSPDHIAFLIGKLKDKSYTETYGEGYTWYTAAEELGTIGKPAIPALIANLDTDDDYERTLTLYALLLATQEPNVKAFASDYIHANLYFDPSTHPGMVAEALAWWEKYKANWE
ncbi:hypothetical protein ACFSL6_06610 [Paenibacillus thailandensis]|uniref:HEAT repeat domain-containing protein n=1 Tax=Paenibacillus thailandensis TaxID=393250 RepID=A0ABW5QTM5_9BACL